jgi:hypothetical protein
MTASCVIGIAILAYAASQKLLPRLAATALYTIGSILLIPSLSLFFILYQAFLKLPPPPRAGKEPISELFL